MFWITVHYVSVSFANILSQSVAYLLILLTLSFTEQKFFLLKKFSLSRISFMDSAFVIVSKRAPPYLRLSTFSPTLLSRYFIVCVLHLCYFLGILFFVFYI